MSRLFFLSLLLFFSCSGGDPSTKGELRRWMTPSGNTKILSTTAMIGDLANAVGGDRVDTIVLIKGQLDPHSYQLVKGDDEKIAFADIIFANGLGLEHGPSLRHALEESPKAVSLGDLLQRDHPELILYYNNSPDPHIWMDVSMWAKTVPYIVEALSKKDPAHADYFHKNGEKLMALMSESHQKIANLLQAIPDEKRYLVTSHDAFNYFARAYLATPDEIATGNWEDRFEAPEGLAPESQLSAHDIQAIIDYLGEYRILTLFPESNVSKDSIRKILTAGREKGMQIRMSNDALYGDAMGERGTGADTYLKMMQKNAEIISKYLTPHQIQ